ncbi:hypothetical protein GCM10010390_10170 [Streptomyces mordarskii]|uniref:Uncharacterized protein n=1 Tax=Streptomyces mordarskii TaxID=1226758 RepID=A0ABN1C0I2_9ACTN
MSGGWGRWAAYGGCLGGCRTGGVPGSDDARKDPLREGPDRVQHAHGRAPARVDRAGAPFPTCPVFGEKTITQAGGLAGVPGYGASSRLWARSLAAV